MEYPRNFTEKQIRYLHKKERLDKIFGWFSLFIFFPLFFVVGILIYVEDGGSIFFRQKRFGIHQSYFTIYKFRTMKKSTPDDIPTHLLKNPERYITKVGRFLRKTSLDELPQIFNLIRGELSVCGPRPALWNQYDLIEEREKYEANSIKPGLTGWAQIHGRDRLGIAEKAKLDGEYVKKFGFWIDLKCFLGTMITAFLGKDVVEGNKNVIREEKGKQAKKNKILIMTNHSLMLWKFRRELIETLLKDGNIVILSMPYGEGSEKFEEMGCKVINTNIDRRGMHILKDWKLLHLYKILLKNIAPDQVMTYSIKPNIYGGIACRMTDIPYYANVQGLGSAFQRKGLEQLVTFLYKIALKKAQVVFFENEENADIFLKKKIISEKRQKVLHGAGVNLNDYRAIPYEEKEAIHFLFAGRIMKEKGVDEFFDAAKRLKLEYGSSVAFDMAGFLEDSSYKKKLQLLEKEGIVHFYGFQKEMRPFYEQTNAIVLPSYHEGMSNVLLEGAAMQRAIIASDISGCKEAVREGINGYLCKVRDKESLYRVMKKFICLTKEERQQMGEEGRKWMCMQFDKEKVVQETLMEIKKRRNENA